jgi:hypothetical protein
MSTATNGASAVKWTRRFRAEFQRAWLEKLTIYERFYAVTLDRRIKNPLVLSLIAGGAC